MGVMRHLVNQIPAGVIGGMGQLVCDADTAERG